MPSARSFPSPRVLGYATFALAGVLLFFLAAFFLREAGRPGRTIRVHFPEIAALSEGDAVRDGGVAVGRVRRIALDGRRAVVELELFRHDPLPADTRFVNAAWSLMGARAVWLVRGASDRALDESRVQEGVFAPGVPETLHAVGALTARIARLRREAEDAGNPASATGRLAAVLPALARVHALLAALPATLDRRARTLESGLEAAARTADAVESGMRAAGPGLDSAQARATALLDELNETARRLERALDATERAARAAGTPEATALLNDRAAYEGLVNAVEALETVLRLLRRDGLDDIAIRPHLRGRAGAGTADDEGGGGE